MHYYLLDFFQGFFTVQSRPTIDSTAHSRSLNRTWYRSVLQKQYTVTAYFSK